MLTAVDREHVGCDAVAWEIVDTFNCYSTKYRRKKAAEVLVPDKVPSSYITRLCVRSPRARAQLRRNIDVLLESRVRKPSLAPVRMGPWGHRAREAARTAAVAALCGVASADASRCG